MARFNPSKIKNMETNDENKARDTFEQPEKKKVCQHCGSIPHWPIKWTEDEEQKPEPESAGQEQENRGARWLNNYFKSLRYDKNHHLGLGDIRLTIAMQDEIIQHLISNP